MENYIAGRVRARGFGLPDICRGRREGGRVPVPPVIPETEEQRRRYEDAGRRRELRASGTRPAPQAAVAEVRACDRRHIRRSLVPAYLFFLRSHRDVIMDSALLIHRLHFAFTVTFHYLFPQLTMGLAPLIVVLKTLALRTQRRALQPGRPVLGAHFRNQFCDRRGHRNSDGISVRHQLVALLPVCGRSDRADAGDGRHVRFLPGVGVSRIVSCTERSG